jgi:hypothetical protein
MEHEHLHHEEQAPHLSRVAFRVTLHCLTGCAIGEVLGMGIGTALEFSNIATILLSIVLAFFFGYYLTLWPLLKEGVALSAALGIAFAADTLSITIMEIVDNLTLLFIPGALDAELDSLLFWGSLFVALAVAFIAAYPANWWLVKKGKRYTELHAHH